MKKIYKNIYDTLKRVIRTKKIRGTNGNRNSFFELYFGSIVISLVLIFLIALMLPRGKSYKYTDLKEKEVYVGDEIIAPFTFAINKTSEEYKRDLQRAEEDVLPVFAKNDSISDYQLTLIRAFFDSLHAIKNNMARSAFQVREANRLVEKFGIKFLDENILKVVNGQSVQNFQEPLIRMARDIYSIGILNRNKKGVKVVDGKISVTTYNEEIIEELNSLYDNEEVKEAILAKLRSSFETDELKTRIGYQILTTFLTPNVIYDPQETSRRIGEARSNVPLAKGTVLEKERIIDRYERITKDHIEKLQSLATELAEREAGQSILLAIVRFFDKFLLISLVISIFIIFLYLNQREILTELKRIILLAVIFLLVTFLSHNIIRFGLSPYLIPIAIGSMLLTIFFDTRVGLVGTIVLSILIGCLRGNEFNISVVSIFTGTVAVLSVSRVKTRKWLVNSILLVSSAYLFSITVMELLRYTSLKAILTSWGYGVINGFTAPLLVYGLQVIFEYFFDIVTNMRLLESSDLNNPLLRKLAIEAPGTYHHSLMVGNLAEAAAEAIGANSLLARVGAYYHDIGKIEKREYFVENQVRIKNPHEKLSPTMSCLILINHVKKGLELAKKYKLPEEIRDFIAEHHGTNLISFFYQKAREKSDSEEINESSFRYPGPRPQSKETGIVMLADAVEAATRSLKDPSASRVKGMIISIVHERFTASELDECPLTMRDLTKIIESFQTILLGTFHARIEYPDQEEKIKPTREKRIKEKNVDLQD